MGDQGASRACPYGARSNLGAGPVKSCDRPRTGFDHALWACPVKSRMGPSPGRYLGSVQVDVTCSDFWEEKEGL